MIKVNGESVSISDIACSASAPTLADLLLLKGLSSGRVAVELNGSVVSGSDFDSTFLNDGDAVEIVHFVGGG